MAAISDEDPREVQNNCLTFLKNYYIIFIEKGDDYVISYTILDSDNQFKTVVIQSQREEKEEMKNTEKYIAAYPPNNHRFENGYEIIPCKCPNCKTIFLYKRDLKEKSDYYSQYNRCICPLCKDDYKIEDMQISSLRYKFLRFFRHRESIIKEK